VVGGGVDGRKVLKGSDEETQFLADNWGQYPVVTFFTECFYSGYGLNVPYRGAVVNLKPKVSRVIESMVVMDTIVGTLEYGVSNPSRFVQVFRMSDDNINNLNLFLSGVGSLYLKDDFEYNDDTTLRANWVASDTNNTQVTLDTAVKYNGSKSMRVQVSGNQSNGDTITKTIVAEDWSGYEYIEFAWRSSVAGGTTGSWEFRIGDGTNWASVSFFASVANAWETKRVVISNMNNIGMVNLSVITKIQFRCVAGNSTHQEWCDYLTAYTQRGSVKVRLYDFGANYNNVNMLPTPMVLDNGMDYVDVDLRVGTDYKVVAIEKSGLVSGRYYGIGVSGVTVGKCLIYGSSSKKYMNGNLYSVDGSGYLNGINDKSMFFVVGSNVEAYLYKLMYMFDGSSGNSRLVTGVLDSNDVLLKRLVDIDTSKMTVLEFSFSVPSAMVYMPKGGKLNIVYLDDSSSAQANSIYIEAMWLTKKHEAWE